LDRALADQVILGVGTNTSFLRELLTHPEVVAGRLDTGFIERHLEELVTTEVPDEVLAVYALRQRQALEGPTLWEKPTGWRPTGPAALCWSLALPGGRTASVQLIVDQVVIDDGTPFTARMSGTAVTMNGRTTSWHTVFDGDDMWIGHEGASWVLREQPRQLRSDAPSRGGDVTSPMPGSVIAVHVSQDEVVTTGQPLVVVEAMKMEHTLTAPVDGTVAVLRARVGQQVAVDELLATVIA
jgi:acetyl-CoA/propionyl-CoA carboxylase biotin carboxyl carrier protein